MRAAAVLTLLLLPVRLWAADPAEKLLEAFGQAGFDELRKSGLIIVHGKPGAWRLQAVDWRTLGELSKRAKAVDALVAARQASLQGAAVAPDFLSVSELPARPPMTPAIHALAKALAGVAAEQAALPEGAPDTPLLFSTRWGKRFAARTHADRVEDPAALAKPFFDQALAAVEPEPGAREHFAGWVSDRHNVDVKPILERDLATGIASEELRGWIRKYLVEERRRLSIERFLAAARKLGRTVELDLAALTAVTRPLAERPGLLAEMETWTRPAAAGPVRFKSVGLHVPQPTRLGQHELGDSIVLAGGYFVDGLADGASIHVEETTYVETEEGFGRVETRTAQRRNGGPYALSRKLTVSDSKPFTFKAVVSAPDVEPIEDAAKVPVGADFETALRRLAVADQRTLLCDFKGAEAAYAELDESLTDAAKEKPQYRELRLAAQVRRRQAANRVEDLAKLEELIAASRADASPDRCDYDASRTETAVRRLRSLPAGCDRLLPDLEKQLAVIRRRHADQRIFASLVEQARSRWRDCSFIPASETFASALAILDADPAARCGKTAALAEEAERELPAARADLLWRDAYTRKLNEAESEISAQKRLALLRPILARIDGSKAPGCFAPQRKRAEALLKKAAEALVSPEPSEVERLLPQDAALSRTADEVAGARRQALADVQRALRQRAEEQDPAAVEEPEEGPAAIQAGDQDEAPKPAVRPARQPAARKRYVPRKRS